MAADAYAMRGSGVILYGKPAEDEAEFIVSLMRDAWPDLHVRRHEASRVLRVLESTDEKFKMTRAVREIFVYASHAAAESWRSEGPSEANFDTMVHVVLGSEAITFVTEARGSKTMELALKVRERLVQSRAKA